MTDDRFGIVGKVVARTYKVRDVVAEGGFGVVYRAFHQGFRAEVALKCLKIPNELTDDQRKSFLEQFRSEAEVLFRLSAHNPHIVRPLHVDAFHTPSQKLVPFMALEWLEGKTLDGLISQRAAKNKHPLSLARVVKLLTPVAGALEQAHNLPGPEGTQTVVHRDMKPENLFIARVGNVDTPKILDFGISKVKSTAGQMAGRASLHADALIAFSPAYAAPEQWAPRSYGQTGRWTDVWGLALTVVEAAKGEEVVIGDQAEMMGTILNPSRRPTPHSEGIAVSDPVEAVFQKALAVDPRHRYQSVGAFWDDLTLVLGLQSQVGIISIQHTEQAARRATTGFDSVHPPKAAPEALSLVPPLEAPAFPAPLRSPTQQVSLDHQPDLGRERVAPRMPERLSSPGFSQPSSSGLSLEPSASIEGRPWSSAAGLDPVASSRGLPLQPRSHPRSYVGASSSSRYAPTRASVWRSLSPSLALVALSVAFTLLDRAVAHSRGVPLSLGPVKASWVAAGLMVIALISGIAALKRVLDD